MQGVAHPACFVFDDRFTETRLEKGQRVFTYSLQKPEFDPKKLRLYRRYLLYQHRTHESDLDEQGYREFFVSSFLGANTKELVLLHNGRPVGLSIIDIVEDVLSSVYFFFDPDVARYSPGVYSMLLEMHLAREMGLAYHYPGYYIEGCPAMNYKARFGPAEILSGEDFTPVPGRQKKAFCSNGPVNRLSSKSDDWSSD